MTNSALPAPGGVLLALAARQVRRGAIVAIALCAGMSVLVVATYRSDAIDPAALEPLARNPAIRTLFGEPVALDDPGGFTVWRTGTVLAVRIIRGEEEAGRWDALLSGRMSLAETVSRHLSVLAVAPVLAGTATAAAMIAADAGAAGAVVHGLGMAAVGLFFVGVGGVAAQVFPSRSAASGAAVAVLVVGLLVRMGGDGVAALAWVRWWSPFGLVALTRPYEANRGLPVTVLAIAAAALYTLAVRLAARRDVGGAILAPSTGRTARRALLGSVGAFAVRRTLRPLVGWSIAIGAYFGLIGLIARSLTDFLTSNPQFAALAAQAGFPELGTVEGYAATLSALLAIPAGVFVAVRLATVAADEAERRLALLLAAPVTRVRLLVAETAAAGGGAVVLMTVAGTATWAGTATVGAGLPLGAALAGAWNVLPIVLLCLGAAVLALGWAPRAVSAVGVLPAVGGFLWHVLAMSVEAPTWVDGVSPFAHLAAVPVTTPDWPAAVVMTGIAGVCAIAGAIGYRHRDVRA
jgi:ABC-2 type transport system permease protein